MLADVKLLALQIRWRRKREAVAEELVSWKMINNSTKTKSTFLLGKIKRVN